jgi:membrane protein required for colicin V production
MNWLDIVLLIVLLVSVVAAFRKGLSREVVGMVTLVAALVLGTWFYGFAGGYLAPYLSSRGLANFVGFLIVFFGVLMAGALVGYVINRFMKAVGLSFFDRALGGVFGFVRGMLISIAVVMAIMAFVPGRRPPQAVVESRLAPYMVDAARVCAAMAPYELRQGFRQSYEEVKSAWNNALRKGIQALPSKEKKANEREI